MAKKAAAKPMVDSPRQKLSVLLDARVLKQNDGFYYDCGWNTSYYFIPAFSKSKKGRMEQQDNNYGLR